jgi:quercetin dioxygenase-like cupin family protein
MTHKKTKPVARRGRLLQTEAAVFVPEANGMLPADVALLALAARPAPAPSAKVKQHLLARVRATQVKPIAAVNEVAGWRFESARAAEGWRETFPGVRFKTLSVDDARDVVMLLVEMKPGARFPDHPHDTSAEEGVLISGDVQMDGRLMGPGDYYHAGLGTTHSNITSPSGCTALLTLRASAWRQWRDMALVR